MSKSNAELQAEFRARRAREHKELLAQVARLKAENQSLRNDGGVGLAQDNARLRRRVAELEALLRNGAIIRNGADVVHTVTPELTGAQIRAELRRLEKEREAAKEAVYKTRTFKMRSFADIRTKPQPREEREYFERVQAAGGLHQERIRELRRELRARQPAARQQRIAALRKTMQREHPDKGGDREKFEAAKAQLNKITKKRKE